MKKICIDIFIRHYLQDLIDQQNEFYKEHNTSIILIIHHHKNKRFIDVVLYFNKYVFNKYI